MTSQLIQDDSDLLSKDLPFSCIIYLSHSMGIVWYYVKQAVQLGGVRLSLRSDYIKLCNFDVLFIFQVLKCQWLVEGKLEQLKQRQT